MYATTRRVGRITVAFGLVALGAGLLMDNLLGASPSFTSLILRFWPALLIGFGAEYLIFSLLDQPADGRPVRLRFDIGGAVLLFLLVGVIAGFHTVSRMLPNPGDYVFALGSRSNRTETATAPAEEAKEVVIEIEAGRVELHAQKLKEVRVEASYGVGGLFLLRDQAEAIRDFQINIEGGETIKVTAQAPQGQWGSISATYTVYVPDGLKVRVQTGAGSIMVGNYQGDLNLSSKVGTIYVEASAGELDAETGSGTIQIEDFDGPVVARTNAGGITLRHVRGTLQLDSGTGMISVEQYTGAKLVAETKTGSIHVDTQAILEGDVLLRTSTGSINLTVPQESSMKVTAQTQAGSIGAPPFVSVTRNGPAQSGVGASGDGRHLVTLEAAMGSIRFQVR